MPPSPAGRWLSLGLAVALLLACAPGFWSDEDTPDAPPLVIAPSWQCPTPSPRPTTIAGYWPTAVPAPSTTPGTPEPIYTTPEPSATPYVRTGSDYFLGQQIQIGTALTLLVTAYTSRPAPQAGMAYHTVTIAIDNQLPAALALLFDGATLRNVRGPDGRAIQGIWLHSPQAAQALGITPSADPVIVDTPDGTWSGGYPPGRSIRTLVYLAPAGAAVAWGMSFDDASAGDHQDAGGGQVWVILDQDQRCDRGPGGGAQDGSPLPPAGTPRVGSGGWPVPLDTPISRGYGCAAFFTGTRGPCGGTTPWWHDGIDFAAPVGTPLFATSQQTVLFAGVDPSTLDCAWLAPQNDPPYHGFGQYVKLSDPNGYLAWYGHVSRWRVQAGQAVAPGQQIADMGKTGCSTGSHLHFRVRLNGLDRNPLELINK